MSFGLLDDIVGSNVQYYFSLIQGEKSCSEPHDIHIDMSCEKFKRKLNDTAIHVSHLPINCAKCKALSTGAG
jgi:hypothetical protein